MNLNWLTLVLGGLAVSQVVRIWFDGSIFESARAYMQVLEGEASVRGFFADLLGCRFCFSVWAGMAVALLLAADQPAAYVPVTGLALSRLENLLRELFDVNDTLAG